jgi:hypothetical protein
MINSNILFKFTWWKICYIDKKMSLCPSDVIQEKLVRRFVMI